MSRSFHRAKSKATRSLQHGTSAAGSEAQDAQVEFNASREAVRRSQRSAIERERKAANLAKGLSREQVKILWLKKRHEIARLKRMYPEVDFDAPDRARANRRKWAKANHKRGCSVRQD